MSRSGYSDDLDSGQLNIWRGAVRSSIRGRRGQAFLKEMLAALDALSEKRLVANALEEGENVCAMGAAARARGLTLNDLDPEDYTNVAHRIGIAEALAREIAYENDEGSRNAETPERRFTRMRAWVAGQILAEAAAP